MKRVIAGILSVILFGINLHGQVYYRDLMFARELMEKQKLYQKEKIQGVTFESFDANNQPIEGFSGTQEIAKDYSVIKTKITDPLSGASENTALFSQTGLLLQTTDSADGVLNTAIYEYDSNQRIYSITNTSVSAGGFSTREEHFWYYGNDGLPVKMVKIKNGSDSTFFRFEKDEKGNIGEEKSVNRGQNEPSVYYYYDDDGRLTDIVRYNNRARRLLPDYMFEYENNRVATMLVVPEGSSDYQKWYYSYDPDGLKIQDACYSKTQALIARVEYKYNAF